MLRPHLLLTILVFAALAAYMVHVMGTQRTFAPLPNGTAQNGSTSNGASSGTSGNNRFPNQRADNDDSSSDDRWGGGGAPSDTPGQFDYYALVLSWSPSYCSDEGHDDDNQCNRRDGRRYSFVLHGLWPQYESGYPSNCRLSRRPYVPEPVINSMLDIMPSRGLVIHEYRAHGTCSGLDPVKYFALARRLFDGITIPKRFQNPFESQVVSAEDVKRSFLEANSQLRPDMMTVVCGGAGGMLKEVRICLSKDGAPRSCGSNETRRNLCTASQVFIPPARSTARSWGNEQPVTLPTLPNTTSRGADHLPGPSTNFDYHRGQ